MKIILSVVFCLISYGITTQAQDTESTLTIFPSQKSDWKDLTSSHQSFNDAAKIKREKFTRILNQLKTALSEELENSQCQIIEDSDQDSVHSSLNGIVEEIQMKKDNENKLDEAITKENEIVPDALYQKVIKKISSAFSKPPNITNDQNNIEMPNMIPIFRPRQTQSRNELNQNVPELNPSSAVRQIPKSRAVSFIPEKIIQTNINPIPSPSMFNIPCQRASDVLDMTNFEVPKQVCESQNVKSKAYPIVNKIKSNLPSQIPAPVALSINSADSEDTVAMLFKPKNISLMQVYGNLLKKITITVLVPYHMSKLGGK